MSPEIEREYKAWIEEAEARLAARVRWGEPSDSRGYGGPKPIVEGYWEFVHLERLKRIREREAVERAKVRTAGGRQ